MYRLKYDPGVEAIHDLLPDALSLRFSQALARACEDPIAHTEPWGEDDGISRTLVVDEVYAMLIIGHQEQTLNVVAAIYLA